MIGNQNQLVECFDVEVIQLPDRERPLIAVIDDEVMNVKILVGHLQQAQYRVREFNSALELFGWMSSGQKPAVIITDVNMPNINGFELCKKIRERYSMTELPIMLITNKDQVTDLLQGFEQGANDYLTRPFNRYELLIRLKTQVQISNWFTFVENTLSDRTVSMKALMDHSIQGFLTFGEDLVVLPEFSQMCKLWFSKEIAGKAICDLLFEQSPPERLNAENILRRIFLDPSQRNPKLFLELLPTDTVINGKTIHLQYAWMDQSDLAVKRILVVMNDMTKSKSIQEQLLIEQNRLSMVSQVVMHRRNWLDQRQRFAHFAYVEWGIDPTATEPLEDVLDYLERHLRKYQLIFSQYHMVNSVYMLETLEQKFKNQKEIAKQRHLSEDVWKQWFLVNPVTDCVNEDFEWLEKNLGQAFIGQSDEQLVSREQLRQFETNLQEIGDGPLRGSLINSYRKLYFRPFLDLIRQHQTELDRLAVTYDKLVAPIVYKGDDVLVDQYRLDAFVQSLMYLFHFQILRSVESVVDRIELSKVEKATINCEARLNGNELFFTIRDDGKGLPISYIRLQLANKGIIIPEDAKHMSDEWFIQHVFMIDELLHIKKALDLLGGTVHVQSVPRVGASYHFWIPVERVSP